MSKDSKVVLTEGSIPKGIIKFAVPVFLGQLFQQMYNMADALIVGNALGSEALAAVTSTGSLIFLLVGFFNGTAIGAGVVIAKYFGAKDYVTLKKAVHTNVTFAIICGVILTILGVLFSPHILRLMGTPADVIVGSTAYLRVYFMGSLALLLYNFCTGILQAVGDSKHPLHYLVISSCTNIVLDIVFCGIFKLGVAYAALATIISQFLSVVLCLRRLLTTDEVYKVYWRELGIDRKMLKEIIKLGLPTGMQNAIISFANVVVQSNINAFGKMAMAGCGSYAKIEGFAFLPVMSFSTAITTFVSQNIGAQKYDRVKKGAVFGIVCSIVLAEIVGIIIYSFAPHLVALFDSTPEVVAFGSLQAATVTLFYFLMAFSHATAAIMRGAGKSTVPMVVMLVAWCLIRVTYITIIVSLFHNIQHVFAAYPITWTISTIIFLIYLFKGKWINGKRVIDI